MDAVISSTKNPLVRRAARLHRRRIRKETNQILVEGPNVFNAAIEAGLTPEMVFVKEDDELDFFDTDELPTSVIPVTGRVLTSLGDTKSPRSPIAVFQRPPHPPVNDKRNLVVLVDVSDPGNVGTIIRTAAALAWDVGLTEHTADAWSPKVLRSAAGAHFATAIHDVPMADIKTLSHTRVAAVGTGGSPSVDSDEPFALLIGSEAHGLPPHIIVDAHEKLTIPMPGGTESLNAAVAAALGMWISTNNDRP